MNADPIDRALLLYTSKIYKLAASEDSNFSKPADEAKAALETHYAAKYKKLFLELLPKGYYSPGEHRRELGETEFYRQFGYNLAIVETREAIDQALPESETA